MLRTYTVAREGFLMNTYRRVGDKLQLHPKQARYLIISGQLDDPDAESPVAEKVAAIFAAAKDSAAQPVAPSAPSAPTKA